MKLKNQRMAKYGLTKFLILFLVSELIRQSADGRRILEDPSLAISTDLKAQPAEAKVLKQAGVLVDWLITGLNYTVKERGDDAYDYKREFKSNKAVLALRNEVLKAFQKDLDIGRITKMNLK